MVLYGSSTSLVIFVVLYHVMGSRRPFSLHIPGTTYEVRSYFLDHALIVSFLLQADGAPWLPSLPTPRIGSSKPPTMCPSLWCIRGHGVVRKRHGRGRSLSNVTRSLRRPVYFAKVRSWMSGARRATESVQVHLTLVCVRRAVCASGAPST